MCIWNLDQLVCIGIANTSEETVKQQIVRKRRICLDCEFATRLITLECHMMEKWIPIMV